MEHDLFDRLARLLAAPASRRSGFAAALAALAAAPSLASARRRKNNGGKGDPPAKPTGPCGDRSAIDNPCRKDSQCCTGYCRPAKQGDKVGRCRCAPEFHPCRKRTVCCPGLTCAAGACQPKRVFLATGQQCGSGSLCSDAAASCTPYAGGGPPGSYCLIPLGGPCAVSTDCVDAFCSAGTCAIRPAGWVYQDEFSSPETGGAYVIAAAEDGLTVYVGAYSPGFVTAWTRPATAGPGALSWALASTIASTGSSPGQVKSPAGISLTELADVLAVADSYGSGSMSVWNGEGASWIFQSKFSGTPSGASGSLSISWDGLTIYLCDYNNSVVSVFTRPNLASTTWTQGASFGNTGPGAVDSPIGSVLSPNELEFYVADSNNSRISIFTRPDLSSQSWSYATSFGSAGSGTGQFATPSGMAIAPNGLTIWVADKSNNRVQVWSRPSLASLSWTYLTAFGTIGSGNGQFSGPYAVTASNGGGYVYVADTGNNRVSVWVAV
ncbi:MAG: hypothetical protein ACKOWF_10930 [Chloroflexota bacterium]